MSCLPLECGALFSWDREVKVYTALNLVSTLQNILLLTSQNVHTSFRFYTFIRKLCICFNQESGIMVEDISNYNLLWWGLLPVHCILILKKWQYCVTSLMMSWLLCMCLQSWFSVAEGWLPSYYGFFSFAFKIIDLAVKFLLSAFHIVGHPWGPVRRGGSGEALLTLPSNYRDSIYKGTPNTWN